MVTLTSEEPSLPCKVKVANLCEAVTGNIHPQFKVMNLCEAGTGNIHQEPILPPEVCENIRNGYLYDGDLVFVILKGIYVLISPKGFWRSLPDISPLFLLFY